ncbi:translation initiation factor IF-3 [candidate division KSB1 bacterium]|nr:translation initiation factor IF-3 [candidate division KSB1 bacterium]
MKPRNYRQQTRTRRTRANKEIRVPQVRLIDQDGNQVGIIDTKDALEQAVEVGLDLVEVSPNATPPVCKILEYGKYKYEISKKEKEGRKKQHTINVKEIRLRPKIDKHDLETKARHARKFLEHGDRVKVCLQFRGREMMYINQGRTVMENFQEGLDDIAKIESPLSKEGRTLVIVLSKK